MLKQENERKMDVLRKQRDDMALQKNDIELKVQAIDREREEI